MDCGRYMEWKRDILYGLKKIPKIGVPGRVVIKGSNAQSILCVDKPGDVIIGAGRIDNGRIVVFPHGGYCASFVGETKHKELSQLHGNIKKWLTRSSYQSDKEILQLTDKTRSEDIKPEQKILYWRGGSLSDEVIDTAETFVRRGGGMLHGMCPWGWLQLNPGKPLEDMPLYKLLGEAGLSYTKDYLTIPKDGVAVPEEDYDEKVLDWKRELLGGIMKLPKCGIPGRVIIYRHEAEAILNTNKAIDTLIAAGKLDRGRIVVIPHGGYSSSFTTEAVDPDMAHLHRNIKQWLTQGTFNNHKDILHITSRTKVRDIKQELNILIWRGGNLDTEVTTRVIEFVKTGGGLFHTMCPWGWLQQNKGKTLDAMPLTELLDMIGVSYTNDYLKTGNDGIILPPASDIKIDKSFRQVLDECLRDPVNLSSFGDIIAYSLSQLRKSAIKTIDKDIEQLYIMNQADIQACTPSPQNKISGNKSRALMAIALTMATDLEQIEKLPGVEIFPGNFDVPPPTVDVDLEIESHLLEFHATGFYLPVGKTMKVIVADYKTSPGWSVRVGAHTDDLSGKETGWRRWPKITTMHALKDRELEIKSPFGGLVYFVSPKNKSKLQVRIENVCESPYFDLRDPKSVTNWKTRRYAPGLWTDLAGELITITVPSATIRELENPSEILRLWDEIVLAHHHLRGTDPRHYRRQWVVTDEQPVAGYMHAGYPIVTGLDVSVPNRDKWLLNLTALKTNGKWGLFHELGHNMQRGEWTFEGTGEVTCNVFTLHAMDTMCDQNPWIHKWLQGSMKAIGEYLNQGAKYSTWKAKAGVGLGIYAQLAHHFGWSCYQKVFRDYEQKSFPAPKTNQEKINRWVQCFSETCQHNLSALFEFWGIPISVDDGSLQYLPVFLPEDEMTTLASDRLRMIQEKYPNLLKIASNVPEYTFDKFLTPPVVPPLTAKII